MRAAPYLRDWLEGASWLLGSSLAERAIAMLQTILIARAIGISDYGRYALFFATIGVIAPLVNLQLGYAVLVQLARWREAGGRAGIFLKFANLVTNVTAALALLLGLALPGAGSKWLFGSPDFGPIVAMGGGLVLLTCKIGMADSVLQAFEQFRALSAARVFGALANLLLLVLAFGFGAGLNEVVAATLAGAVVRYMAVAIPARRHTRDLKTVASLSELASQWPVLVTFCLPSALMSFVGGYYTWIGPYVLSHAPEGLADVAAINAANQWRSPLLMVTAALASSLLPKVSRAIEDKDHTQTRALARANLAINLGMTVVFAVVVSLLAGPILGLYGPDFRSKIFVFVLFIWQVVALVYINAHQQIMVAAGNMWWQFVCVLPNLAIITLGAMAFGAGLTGEKLGYLQLGAAVATALVVAAVSRHLESKRAAA